jgi:hypothetical protein
VPCESLSAASATSSCARLALSWRESPSLLAHAALQTQSWTAQLAEGGQAVTGAQR